MLEWSGFCLVLVMHLGVLVRWDQSQPWRRSTVESFGQTGQTGGGGRVGDRGSLPIERHGKEAPGSQASGPDLGGVRPNHRTAPLDRL